MYTLEEKIEQTTLREISDVMKSKNIPATVPHLSRVFNGRGRNWRMPSVALMVALADHFEVTLEEMRDWLYRRQQEALRE